MAQPLGRNYVVGVTADVGEFVQKTGARSARGAFRGPEPVIQREVTRSQLVVWLELREPRHIQSGRRGLAGARRARDIWIVGSEGHGGIAEGVVARDAGDVFDKIRVVQAR